MDSKQKVLDTLDALGVSYQLIEHPPVHTIEEMDALGVFTAGNGQAVFRNFKYISE